MARGLKFGLRLERDCTVRAAKTKTLISFVIIAKLICVFGFAYVKIRFSHDEAPMFLAIGVYVLALFSPYGCVKDTYFGVGS